MRFNTAWAKVAKENVSLKYSLMCMSVVSILLGIGFLQTAMKDPIVVDRSCQTKVLEKANAEPTVSEIKEFSRKALLQRYSGEEKVKESFLSSSEISKKQAEEETFKKKNVIPLALVRSITVKENVITAQVDRIFSMGESRPGYPTEVILDIQSTARSVENPYGLILSNVSSVKAPQDKEVK